MPYLQSQAVPRDPHASWNARVNRTGDLVCPHCGVNLITPAYARVVAGWGRCACCAKAFRVTQRLADACARIQEQLAGGVRVGELERSL